MSFKHKRSLFRQSKTGGFTLIELMISMSIFAILSLLAYGGLSSVIKNKQGTEVAMQRLHQLQLTMTKLHRDFEQLASRGVTDGINSKLLKLSSGQGDELLVQFTRNGWRNPANNIRSHLQRVAYKLEDDTLIRMGWLQLDRAEDDQLIETRLIDNLEEVELRFLDQDNSWQDSWPTNNASASNDPIPLPRAVEVTLITNDWGEIRRVFRVASATL